MNFRSLVLMRLLFFFKEFVVSLHSESTLNFLLFKLFPRDCQSSGFRSFFRSEIMKLNFVAIFFLLIIVTTSKPYLQRVPGFTTRFSAIYLPIKSFYLRYPVSGSTIVFVSPSPWGGIPPSIDNTTTFELCSGLCKFKQFINII